MLRLTDPALHTVDLSREVFGKGLGDALNHPNKNAQEDECTHETQRCTDPKRPAVVSDWASGGRARCFCHRDDRRPAQTVPLRPRVELIPEPLGVCRALVEFGRDRIRPPTKLGITVIVLEGDVSSMKRICELAHLATPRAQKLGERE